MDPNKFRQIINKYKGRNAIAPYVDYLLNEGLSVHLVFGSLPEAHQTSLIETYPELDEFRGASPAATATLLEAALRVSFWDDDPELYWERVSQVAIEKIQDPAALRDIIRNHGEISSRLQALNKLPDDPGNQDFFRQLLTRFVDFNFAYHVIPRLRDPQFLRQIVVTWENYHCRYTAFQTLDIFREEMMESDDSIAELAVYILRNDDDEAFKIAVMPHVTDRDALRAIVRDTSMPLGMRQAALRALGDSEEAARIALQDTSQKLRLFALDFLMPDQKTSLETSLTQLALHAEDPLVRGRAVKLLDISKQDVLKKVADYDPDPHVAERARVKLSPDGALPWMEHYVNPEMQEFIKFFLDAGAADADIYASLPPSSQHMLAIERPGWIIRLKGGVHLAL